MIVFLRSGFGYAYLRPKAVFFAFSWAFGLYTAYSWLEPGQWTANGAFCTFGVAAMLLYWLHLSWTFATELRGNATHDNDSGKPHTLRILGWFGVPPSPAIRNLWVIWIEPGLVLLAAFAVQLPRPNFRSLSTWLLLAAISLWLKEALNYWLQLRQRKRQRGTMDDAKEGLEKIRRRRVT